MKRSQVDTRTSSLGRRDFIRLGAGGGAMTAAALTTSGVSAQSGTSRPVAVDLHTHWAPEAYLKIRTRLRWPTPASQNPLNFDLDKRRTWMDDHGIQMHTLTLGGAMPWQWVPEDVSAHLASVVNDAAIEAHTAFPDRFVAGIELPIRSPELALKELNRVAGKPGLRAVSVPTSYEGRDYLFDATYTPLLARIEELGYPLLLHPLDGEVNTYGGNERLNDPLSKKAGLGDSIGYPLEIVTVAAKFIFSRTLDKFPRLNIVLLDAGGVLPYLTGRADRYSEGRVSAMKLESTFREYVRRFYYDTLTYNPESLRFLIRLVGSDHVVVGSENFTLMSVERPTAMLEQLNLPAADRDSILRGNAARLLKL